MTKKPEGQYQAVNREGKVLVTFPAAGRKDAARQFLAANPRTPFRVRKVS